MLSRSGGTADALASGASGSNIVWVQIPSPAFFVQFFIPFVADVTRGCFVKKKENSSLTLWGRRSIIRV